jgi:hypothetical protein
MGWWCSCCCCCCCSWGSRKELHMHLRHHDDDK